MQRKSKVYQALAGLAMLTATCCGQGVTTYTVNYAVTGLVDGTSITLQGNGATLATITQSGGPFRVLSTSSSGFSIGNSNTSQTCGIASSSQPDSSNTIAMVISCALTGSSGLGTGGASNLTPPPSPPPSNSSSSSQGTTAITPPSPAVPLASTCSNPAGCFVIGTVLGMLPGTTLELSISASGNNQSLTVAGALAVQFTTTVPAGSPYSVSLVQPGSTLGQSTTCTVNSAENSLLISIVCTHAFVG